MTPTHCSTTNLGDVSIRYSLRTGRSRPLVLLHELGGTLENWDRVIELLPADTTVLRYDMRGAGMSEKIAGNVTLDDLVSDLEALLDALNLRERCVLAGGALGGATVLRFAARHPSRTAAVIAHAPAVGLPHAARTRALEFADALEHSSIREAFAARLDAVYPPALRSQGIAFEEFKARFYGNDPRSLAALLRIIPELDMTADLAEIACPATITAGTLDPGRPPDVVRPVADAVRGAQFVVLETAHYATVQTPHLLARVITGTMATR